MAARANGRKAGRLTVSVPRVTPIPIFDRAAREQLQAITNKFRLPRELSLGQDLTTIYFSHSDLWLRRRGSKALKRSAAKIKTATRKYMSVLSTDSFFAHLLCAKLESPTYSIPRIEDINTLTLLLQRLLDNSRAVMRAKVPHGRAKDPLAVTVVAELGALFDNYFPSSSRGMQRGVSRSTRRIEFIQDTLMLFNLPLTEDSIRTYRQNKNMRRVRAAPNLSN
jgi:hypothetical protein